MIDNSLVVLETENLFLKKIIKTDFRLFCGLHQNPIVMRYFEGGQKTMDEARTRLNDIIKHQNKYGFSYYNVFLKEANEYIGQTGLYYNSDMSVNLCYAFLEKFQGKGYATEAIIAVLKQGFDIFKFPIICAMSAVENHKSRHLLEKLGAKFSREGVLISGMRVIRYLIKKDEFYEAISKLKTYTYKQAVGCMLINKDKQIYMFERADFPDSWQCPEGGIEKNESELDAAFREIYEEIGIDKEKLKLIKISHNVFRYNFEEGYKVNECDGQKKRFFLFEFLGNDSDFNYTRTKEKQEFLNFKLVSKDEILQNNIPLFKKDMYIGVMEEFYQYL
jgi:putative (di)nucleoside polyphosphate hydrolase